MTTTPDFPGVPGDRILRALGRYHLLTREQLTRLLYRAASTTFVGEHLTRLTRRGYLRMGRVPLAIPVGGTPGWWTLREPGRRYLRAAGVDLPPRRALMPPTSPYHLWHLVALNDALIALDLLCRAERSLELERLRHDLVLRRAAPRVTLPDGRATTAIPDAWVDLAVAGAPMGIALELDRGTEDERQWARKLDGLLALGAGPYREAFAADSMTVAVVTTGGERRQAALLRWTETALTRRGKGHWGELFWFAHADPAATDPAALYLGPRWVRPFDPVPRSLIALENGSSG
jgi:Replication-relaxation